MHILTFGGDDEVPDMRAQTVRLLDFGHHYVESRAEPVVLNPLDYVVAHPSGLLVWGEGSNIGLVVEVREPPNRNGIEASERVDTMVATMIGNRVVTMWCEGWQLLKYDPLDLRCQPRPRPGAGANQ